MNKVYELVKDYYTQNKMVLVVYLIVSSIFYVCNFIFFSSSIDVPADLIFISLYLLFSPGIVILVTIIRSKVSLLQSNHQYYINMILHSVIVLLINLVMIALYTVIRLRADTGYWEYLYKLVPIAIPFMFFTMIIAYEYKLRFEKLFRKIILTFLIIVIWYVTAIILKQDPVSIYMIIVNVVLFIVIPFLLIVIWYRKKLVD